MSISAFLPPSTSVREINRGSDVLVVSFRVPFPGIDPHQHVDFGETPFDEVQFISPPSQWFAEGIPETFGNPGSFEDGLRRFIASGQYREVIFFGRCAGAYGAMDFGLRCGATAIIALRLESLFGLCRYFNHRASREAADIIRRRIKEWPAVSRAVSPRIFPFYGAESVPDLLYARACRRQIGASPLFLRRSAHDPALLKLIRLPIFFRNLVEHRELGIEKHLVNIDLKRLGPFGLAYWRATRGRPKKVTINIEPRDEVERYMIAATWFQLGEPRRAWPLLQEGPDDAISERARLFLLARAMIASGVGHKVHPMERRLRALDPRAFQRLEALYPEWARRSGGAGKRSSAVQSSTG
jgi:hypothetical protein